MNTAIIKTRADISKQLKIPSFAQTILQWIFLVILFAAFALPTSFYFLEVDAVGASIFACIMLGLVVLEAGREIELRLVADWTDFYRGSRWNTLSGEKIIILNSNRDGSRVKVEFEDGDIRSYPLWLLEPTDDFEPMAVAEDAREDDRLLHERFLQGFTLSNGIPVAIRDVTTSRRPYETTHLEYVTFKSPQGIEKLERRFLVAAPACSS